MTLYESRLDFDDICGLADCAVPMIEIPASYMWQQYSIGTIQHSRDFQGRIVHCFSSSSLFAPFDRRLS